MNRVYILLLMLQCLSAVAQNDQSSVSTQKAATDLQQATPLFISPIIPIPLKGPIIAPLPAQANDRLLWYKGKKIDDSTIITVNSTLVRWSKPRDMVIVQPKKDPFAKMATELGNTQKRKDQFYEKMAERKNSVLFYPAIVNTMEEYDAIASSFAQSIKNTINLPPALATTAYNIKMRIGGVASFKRIPVTGLPDYIKKGYQDVMTAMKNYPPVDFPVPPEWEFGACYSFQCDSNAYKQLFDKRIDWQEEFIKYEAEIIRKSMSIIKTIGQSETLKSDPEAASIEAGLEKAMEFAGARINNKTDILIRKYGKDFKRLPAIISIVLSVERQKQLLGVADESSSGTKIIQLSSLFDGFEKYIEQQMDARNYDVVLNIPFIIGIERQRQLMGAGDDENKMAYYIDKINVFNRFKLDVQIDYAGEWKGCGIEKASFTATNLEPFFVQLGLINCKYNFFISEEYINKSPYPVHYGDSYHHLLQVTNGTGTESKSSEDGEQCWQIKHDLKGLVIRPYEPIASISFCENGTDDSLQFYSLHLPVSRENREDIRYSYAKFKHFDTQLQNDGMPSGDLPAEIEQLAIEQGELKSILREYQTKSGAKPSLQEMEKHHLEANRAKWLQRKLNEYEERKNPSVIVFDAKNGSEVIIDEKTQKNYYENIPEADVYEKADITVRVKIVHDPLPYKTAVKK